MKPAPRPVSWLPPPRADRPANVAKRDNQARRKEQPQDIKKNPVTVLDMAAVDPVEAARRCQAEISTLYSGFYKEKRRLIAEAYAIARGLEDNPQEWSKFLEDPFWEKRTRKPTIDDRTEPLLHVMVFVFKAIDRNIYKRASKYAAALKRYSDDDVPAREVAAKIKEDGGIETLYRASIANEPRKKPEAEQSLTLTFSASEARREALLALSEGQEADLMIRRVTGERGVVARIVKFYPVKA